jgi:2,4-dienoyl-CoA reductase-like NADH-dependent reductase (Old Yellow Enzyme family)/thioredoxin reductase
MGTKFGSDDGFVTKRAKAYYEARAAGGAGLIIIEVSGIDFPAGRALVGLMSISDDKYVPGMRELVDRIHRHGAKACLQLHHAGAETTTAVAGRQPVGPSAVQNMFGEMARELSVAEILELEDKYAEAAERAKWAGFDAVEIQGSSMYLVAQFLSPYWNKRLDDYGGTAEKRARFLVEIIQACKQAVGPAFPVWGRFHASEYGADDCVTVEDAIVTAKMTQDVGADAVHISCMGFGREGHRGPIPLERGHLVLLGEQIKNAVSVPLITVGGLTPQLAESVLEEGKADFVSLGRALIADPDIPRKLTLGTPEDIRPCILCFDCAEELDMGRVQCSVNALAGNEEEYRIEPTKEPKSVVVVGGGPGGMEAARVAALRGHKVTLYEKKSTLGGQLLDACIAPYKSDIKDFVDYLVNQISKLGIKVKLGKEVTPEEMEKLTPDAVVIACGLEPLTVPPIPGLKEANPVFAQSVLREEVSVGDKVIVIGGGMVGLETAEHLADKGKKVTVVEITDRLASGLYGIPRAARIRRLRGKGVLMLTGTKVGEVRDKQVIVTRATGEKEALEFDTVVLAAGAPPAGEPWKALKGKVGSIHFVGDCIQPRGIFEAIHEGNKVGRII